MGHEQVQLGLVEQGGIAFHSGEVTAEFQGEHPVQRVRKERARRCADAVSARPDGPGPSFRGVPGVLARASGTSAQASVSMCMISAANAATSAGAW